MKKKVLSVVLMIIILISTAAPAAVYADGGSYVTNYTELCEWLAGGSDFAHLQPKFTGFGWPSEDVILEAAPCYNDYGEYYYDKVLSFDYWHTGDVKSWTVPENVTIKGVSLTNELSVNINGKWEGDISVDKLENYSAGTLSLGDNSKVTGLIKLNVPGNTYSFNGEVDGSVVVTAESTIAGDWSVSEAIGFNANGFLRGNLDVGEIVIGNGYYGGEAVSVIIESGSVTAGGENQYGSCVSGQGTLTINGGAAFTTSHRIDAKIVLKSGGVMKLKSGGRIAILDEGSLHLEKDSVVNTYADIDLSYPGHGITGEGTIKLYGGTVVVVIGDEGEQRYSENTGDIPDVESTVIFETAECVHENSQNKYYPYEYGPSELHYYICDLCTCEIIDPHRFTGAVKLPEENSGEGYTVYTCLQCKYEITSDIYHIINNGTLTLIGSGDMMDYNYASSQPYYTQKADITKAVVSAGITNIGAGAFNGFEKLEEVEMPEGITEIHTNAFFKCSALESITLPTSVERIESAVFSSCTSLKSISLPAGITKIGNNAFNNCTALTDVYYAGTEEQWNAVTIGKGNAYLLGATVHYNSNGDGETEKPSFDVETEKVYTVTASSVPEGASIILALYKGGAFVGLQRALYAGESVKFTVKGDYDSVKVMCWNSLAGMKPLCTSAEIK